MKETGIMMSTEMVKAILDGRKTMTRRTWGLEKVNKNPDNFWLLDFISNNTIAVFDQPSGEIITIKCPYGGVGDWLWVKETFWIEHDSDWDEYSGKLLDCGINIAEDDWAEVRYCATDMEPSGDYVPLSVYSKRPSIHMPRWASRIWRQITEIRAERLQDITEGDARSEGIDASNAIEWYGEDDPNYPDEFNAQISFKYLWDSLNAKAGHGWDKNEWVWP
ncbi:unnamed protein product, partial [marine sediment metagenome]